MDELLRQLLSDMADPDAWAERVVSADARAVRLNRLASVDRDLDEAREAGDGDAIDFLENEALETERSLGFR